MSNGYRPSIPKVVSRESLSKEEAQIQASLGEDYPAIATMLGGVPGTGADEGVPRHTLMVYIRNGVLGFCLSVHKGPQCAFGVVEDPCKLLESIEAALQRQEFSWKPKK